jgi:dihydroorotate dehydrogenase
MSHHMKTLIIGVVYRQFFKRIFFLQDPEKVHDRFTKASSITGRYKVMKWLTRVLFDYRDPSLSQEIAGIKFENPVGLSAGFDKDGHFTQILPDVGFGFMQIGSVTANSYDGNPKPRLTRLKKSKAIVVYYGLKNEGVSSIIKRLLNKEKRFPYSFSIAKTNCDATADTEAGIKDYIISLKALEKTNLADFYTLNISCPNTFGGEPFTDSVRLKKLLEEVGKLKIKKPIFLKMPINTPWKEFRHLLNVAVANKITGVVIGNLQKNHKDSSIKDVIPANVKGGISGKPTQKLCDSLISKTYKEFSDDLIIVGVGGVFTVDDAWQKIRKGASLVQLITGMIFQGPQLIGEINAGLVKKLKSNGFTSIDEAIGSAHR